MKFSPKFTSWARSQSSPCAVLCNVGKIEKPILKLSGGINWEARNEMIHEDNRANRGLPGEGQPKF